MTRVALADLSKLLAPHVPLGKSRLETLCLLVLGVISARTVNLTHIAAERPARAKVASTYRRLQRFFQQVALPEDWSIRLDQAAFSVHIRSALTKALANSMSLRITATIATFAGFPASRRASYRALRSGL